LPEACFNDALALLLKSASNRDSFRKSRHEWMQKIGVREKDRPAILGMDPSALELQAGTLVRKRLEALRQLLPQTFCRSKIVGLEKFSGFAETSWPAPQESKWVDAYRFVFWLKKSGYEVDGAEAAECAVRGGGSRVSSGFCREESRGGVAWVIFWRWRQVRRLHLWLQI
jgi:hypothetical protein